MRDKIFWWLLKRYIRKNKDIMKIDEAEEMRLFLFKNADDVNKLVRAFLTNQTIKHWEATNDDNRNIVKGMAIAFKVLRDGHKIATDVYDVNEKEKSLVNYKTRKKRSFFKKYFIY